MEFTKFLVASDGKTVKRFPPTSIPERTEEAVECMLAE